MPETDTSDQNRDSVLPSVSLWRVANVLGLLFLIGLVLPFIIFMFPQLIGAQQSYVVLSGSMEPTISTGDAVFIDSVEPSEVERGDIINFRKDADSRTTTHRVIAVVNRDEGVAFRTKGDNNEDPDQSLVSPRELQGKVMAVRGHPVVIPYIGYVIQFAGTRSGYMLLIAVPLTLLVVSEIWNLVKSTRGGSADKNQAAPHDSSDVDPSWEESGSEADVEAVTSAEHEDGHESGASDAELTLTQERNDGDSDSALTFSTTELHLGLFIAVAFTIYSLWVAFDTTEIWSVAVAASVLAGLCLLLSLYLFGGSDTSEDTQRTHRQSATDGGETRIPVVKEPIEEGERNGNQQSVSNFETLVELAQSVGEPICVSPDESKQCVVGDSALYIHEGEVSDDWEWEQQQSDDTGLPATDSERPTVPVAERPLAHEDNIGTRQPVGEFETLVEVADAMKRPIYRDPTETIQYVTGPASVFIHDGEPGDEWTFDALTDDSGEATATGSESDD